MALRGPRALTGCPAGRVPVKDSTGAGGARGSAPRGGHLRLRISDPPSWCDLGQLN